MNSVTTALYQVEQIAQMEKMAIEQLKISDQTLMERAGSAAWSALLAYYSKKDKILVLCGKGNNAGDGFVVARLAFEMGKEVCIRCVDESQNFSKLAALNFKRCQDLGMEIKSFDEKEEWDADVIVDAILGIGFKGRLTSKYEQAINKINHANIPVLAIDIPSGVEADTGNVASIAVYAIVTITFLAYKQGLFTGKAMDYCGQLILNTLDLPLTVYQNIKPQAYKLGQADLSTRLTRKRPICVHKGDFGHILIVGGNVGMSGAVRLTAEAAARVGAGLVTVATHPAHADTINIGRPEIMSYPVNSGKDLKPLIARANVIAIGNGLGQDKWAQDLLDAVMQTDIPKVIDADALNLLTRQPKWSTQNQAICTPHPGEAARLLNVTSAAVQEGRFNAIDQLQKTYGGVWLLKGAGTIIKNEQNFFRVLTVGNPGMASAGMGDLLSGVIGGLLAQHWSLTEATCDGALLHALAGDSAAHAHGQRGLLASDLIPFLRRLVNAKWHHHVS